MTGKSLDLRIAIVSGVFLLVGALIGASGTYIQLKGQISASRHDKMRADFDAFLQAEVETHQGFERMIHIEAMQSAPCTGSVSVYKSTCPDPTMLEHPAPLSDLFPPDQLQLLISASNAFVSDTHVLQKANAGLSLDGPQIQNAGDKIANLYGFVSDEHRDWQPSTTMFAAPVAIDTGYNHVNAGVEELVTLRTQFEDVANAELEGG